MTTNQLTKIYKALSNENRLEIFLSILKSDEKNFETGCDCTISLIMQKLGIGAPTISHHLKELNNAGLIETKKEGKYLVAHVNKELLNEIKTAFDFIEK
ncbi:MAG: metalloregulator ArsR/SmtB family transcription factor [Bacillota bacterium]|nr:metalloregulator ArsR/SmtB family transcription factor [Bacillota bacterium]